MEIDRPIVPHKGELLEEAFRISPYSTVADLGGCWGVNGGYTIHIVETLGNRVEKAYIVDQHLTNLTVERTQRYPAINLVHGMLGSEESRAAVGNVDALIMYDILLHQVKPDWDDFIRSWLSQCKMVIVYNQNWIKSPETVRFNEHGLEWFKENSVYTSEENLDKWFSELDDFDEVQKKQKRDVFNFWQWGIYPYDIIDVFKSEGFNLCYMKRFGEINKARPWIVNDGMIFARAQSWS